VGEFLLRSRKNCNGVAAGAVSRQTLSAAISGRFKEVTSISAVTVHTFTSTSAYTDSLRAYIQTASDTIRCNTNVGQIELNDHVSDE